MVHSEDVSVRSTKRTHWVDITDEVARVVSVSGVKEGIVMVASLHTTAGITLNENADPDVERDVFWKLGQLIPQENAYHHVEGNSDSHLKASLVGLSAHVPVRGGKPVLGTWQSIYFCEFDGPRNRRVVVTVAGE
ncbi:MAG: YjbQ family protein [Chitinivibrionales bacterium]|nr:YjbQ family protein [Chitinivibrionales bacterium]MBD3355781.1 YjbQ family protein [Chitinivibrionales bacterium]